MEDFFKPIKDNLEAHPEPPFDERVWRKVETSLDREENKKRPALLWWWAALPLLFLLLASNAYTLLELKKTNKNIATLTHRTDTVFQKQVIYISDTIYQTKVVYEAVRSQYLKTNNTLHSVFGNTTSEIIKNKTESKNIHDIETDFPTTKNNLPVKEFISENILPKNISQLKIAPIKYREKTPELNTSISKNYDGKKDFREIWKKTKQQARMMVPNKIRVGPNATFIYPIGKENINPSPGYAGGFSIQFENAHHLRLNAEMQFGKVSFETEKMNPEFGVPIFTPPNNEFEFKYADAPQPFSQFSAAIQYPFLYNKKIRPVIGLGLGSVSVGTYDVTYEYTDPTSELEAKYEQEFSTQIKHRNIMLAQLGLEREVNKKWSFQIMVNYRGDLNPENNPLPNSFGLHSNLFYEF